jgi:hypothetical protein
MRALRTGAAIFFSVLITLYYTLPARANASLEEVRELLQKGLTIYEIDRELVRLGEQEEQIALRLSEVGENIRRQEAEMKKKKEAAGKVLRSYYMGQRRSLVLALIRMDNFYDMLRAYDLMKRIYRHDRRVLESYRDQLNELKSLERELASAREQMREVRELLVAERDQLLRVQSELDAALAIMEQDEAEQIRRQIEALTRQWEAEGLPLFQAYFAALADTIRLLPEVIMNDSSHLSVQGSELLFRISDEQLNSFLWEKNPMFERLKFTFADGIITVTGQDAGQELRIAGRYLLRTEPENRLDFSIEELEYNGLLLPDSTRADLARQFDLSISVEHFELEMEVTDVRMEDNRLIIHLKMKRNWLDSLFGRLR